MYFFWVDCEMTGLDWETDHILEIAYIITDLNMTILFQGHHIVYHPLTVLEGMSDWCRTAHSESGLWEKVLASKSDYTAIEISILSTLQEYTESKKTYVAGNSVYTDFCFLKKWFPALFSWMHYRLFDISSLKLLAMMKGLEPFLKLKKHEAVSDIEESIAEYSYYKKHLIKN